MHPHYDLIMLWAKNPRDMQVSVWDESCEQWVKTNNPCWRPERTYRVAPKTTMYPTLQMVQHGQKYRYVSGGPVYTRLSIPADMYGNPRSNPFDRSFGITTEHQLDVCRNPNAPVKLVA